MTTQRLDPDYRADVVWENGIYQPPVDKYAVALFRIHAAGVGRFKLIGHVAEHQIFVDDTSPTDPNPLHNCPENGSPAL